MRITERLRARKVANVIEVEGDTPRIRGQMPDALCIEAADEIDRLSADLREEQDRRQAMRNEWGAEVAALTAQARHAGDCLEAAKARIAELESPIISDAMVAAYLDANTTYWRATDEVPPPLGVWRTGTPHEATRAGLAAALTASKPSVELGVGFSGGHCQTPEISYEPPTPLDWSDSTEGEKS